MEIWNWFTGLGILGVIIGLFLLATWKDYTFQGLDKGMKNLALIGGVVFIVGGLAGMGYMDFSTVETADIEPLAAGYDITAMTGADAELVRISGTDNWEWRIDHNGTGTWDLFEANTQWITLNISLEGSGLSTIECTNTGSFTVVNGANVHNGETISLIGTDGSGTADIAYWVNSGDYTGYKIVDGLSTGFPRLESHTDGFVLINITASAKIPAYMDTVGDSGDIVFDVCGNLVTIHVRVNNVA